MHSTHSCYIQWGHLNWNFKTIHRKATTAIKEFLELQQKISAPYTHLLSNLERLRCNYEQVDTSEVFQWSGKLIYSSSIWLKIVKLSFNATILHANALCCITYAWLHAWIPTEHKILNKIMTWTSQLRNMLWTSNLRMFCFLMRIWVH